MEAKKILCLIKDDISHLEEITRELTGEILPPPDDVDLAIVRAKALITELELLRKLTSLKISEPNLAQQTVIQDHKLTSSNDFAEETTEPGRNIVAKDSVHIQIPEVTGIVQKDIDPKVEKGNNIQKPVIEG